MSYAPFRENTQVYKGTTFGFSFTIDEDGSPLDLTTLDKVEAKLFSSSTNIFTFDTDGDLSISGASNNIVSGVASESTMDIAKRIYYLELWLYFSDGSKEAYSVIDVKIIDAESDQSQGAHDWVLDIDNDSETVTGQATSNLAEAIQAKEDVQSIKDSIEWKGPWDTNTTYAKDNRVSYQGESFISLQDGNQGNTPVGDSNDSFWDILVEQSTTTNTVDETDTTQSVTGKAVGDYDQKIIEAHGYYSRRFSNLEQRIRDLENA